MEALAQRLGERLIERRERLATAESCTGGWLAEVLTSIPGSSAWFERGFVTYSNEAKSEMLGVDPRTLARFGAVSEQTVCEMAEGALRHSHAELAIAITGIAGPEGGSVDKPVGTVWIAWANPDQPTVAALRHFEGDRRAIRAQAVQAALLGLLSGLK